MLCNEKLRRPLETNSKASRANKKISDVNNGPLMRKLIEGQSKSKIKGDAWLQKSIHTFVILARMRATSLHLLIFL